MTSENKIQGWRFDQSKSMEQDGARLEAGGAQIPLLTAASAHLVFSYKLVVKEDLADLSLC